MSLQGIVVHGRGIGKLVGSPTANLELSSKENIPAPGVYVSSVLLNEEAYYAITHIGKRPTVDNDDQPKELQDDRKQQAENIIKMYDKRADSFTGDSCDK